MPNHIKIYGVKPRIQYVADGNLKKYEFPFAIFKTSDIDVYLDDKLQEQSAFTVSASPDTQGGTVIFETAPANGIIISLVRNLSIERTTDFQEGGVLRAKVLNDEFDYQTACLQQVADNLNRSMVLPPYATDNDLDLTLPTPSAGKAIVWNAKGTNLENSAVKINELESTLKGYKESAESAASIATEKATIASDKADIATVKAQLASDKADIATSKAAVVSEALSTKANIAMDNLTSVGTAKITDYCMPDYANQIYAENIPRGTKITCPKDSQVVVWGKDQYIEDYYAYVYSPNDDGPFVVGYRGDDTNGNTEWGCFSFLVPAGWKFTCTAENGFYYRIYPLKGA